MMMRVLQKAVVAGAVVASCVLGAATTSAQGVFLDPGLHEAVRLELVSLGADPGATIEADEMVGVNFTEFTNNSGLIFDVTGLEYATDLTHLDLASNRIFNVAPLASLTKLEYLSLAMNGNSITPEWLSDYTPLRKLVSLRHLDIAFNHVVEDLGFVQDLVNLEVLDISFNKLEDIGAVHNLVNLRELYASFNEIKNISMLTELEHLEVLDLSYNEIVTIKPLTKNVNFDSGDEIFLHNNPLSASARCGDLASLEDRLIVLDITSECLSFTQQDYVNVIQDVVVPDQLTMAAMDLNADYKVDVADLIRFLGTPSTSIPDVRGDSLASATVSIESGANLNVADRIATAPFVAFPAVKVVGQDPPGTPLPVKSEVNVTVSIPPDSFDFLTKGSGVSDAVGRAEALAYYRAIDPDNRKDTLAKFIAENRFGQPGGIEASTVYFSAFDLGLGRDMHMRRDGNYSAFYVTNHVTVDDAWQNQGNPIATVAMEYSPGPNGGDPFIKFYTFDQNGERDIEINLDGRGDRYQPNMCMTCHGGSPGFLIDGEFTSFVSGKGYVTTGDTGARYVPYDLDTLEFSEISVPHSRAAQEAEFKKMNRTVRDHLVSLQATTTYNPQATIDLIEGWYGGPGMTGTFNGLYVPPDWAGNPSLYLDVVRKSCRTCHIQQVAGIDFASYAAFQGYASIIGDYVYEDGFMPNSLKAFQDFWLAPDRANTLASFVLANDFEARDFTDVGPGYPEAFISLSGNLSSTGNELTLSGEGSNFATEYEWTVLSVPPGSAITTNSFEDRHAPVVKFTPDVATGLSDNTYNVRLTVSKNGLESTVIREIGVDQQTVSFSGRIVPMLQQSSTNCDGCHNSADSSGTGFNVNLADISAGTIYNELVNETSAAYGVKRVIPGNAFGSLLNTIMNGHSGTEFTGQDLTDLRTWINEGALNN